MARPNFVLIMTDTQGANVVGCYNRAQAGLGTDRIDRLAAEGVRFERAYTSCPLCTPARGGLFTGLTPSVNGAHSNNLAPGWNIRHLGEHFRAAGYRTAYTGKWHLDGLDYFDSGVCPPGWEDAYWYDGRRYLDDLTDEEIHQWRHNLGDHPAGFTWAHRLGDRAERFLAEAARVDEPFLLVVSYDEPHGPSVCPPEYVERFADFRFRVGPGVFDDLADKPAHHREWAAGRKTPTDEYVDHAQYFACNSFVDDEIGRVIDAVNRYAPDDTYILYTSDHGDQFGAHGMGGKGPVMYEETTRVPFIVRPPRGANAQPGRVVDGPVSHLDVLPTMLELAGQPVPPVYHGQSLAGVLAGGDLPAERAVLMEFTRFSINHDGWGGYQPIRALVRGRFKLVVNLLDSDELYDLQADPHELANRIADPALAAQRDALHDALLAEMDRIRDPFRGPAWERRPWRVDRKQGWGGLYRHRPDDGFSPATLAYSTGKPPESWVMPGNS